MHLKHLNLPDGSKVGIPIETTALLRSLERRLAQTQARVAELEKDAARYRWLKENHLQTGADSWIRTGDDLEEAIDAALKDRA